ncbi:MAG: hypothetical protein Q9166_005949, partial [cf. Caloplaca sp. 2 TL-2023]
QIYRIWSQDQNTHEARDASNDIKQKPWSYIDLTPFPSFAHKKDRVETPLDLQHHAKAPRANLPFSCKRSGRWRYAEGWRVGAIASCIVASMVLIINCTVVGWVAGKHSFVNGVGTVFSGNCDGAKSKSVWLQLAINVLSSTLLAASNYCMQRLGSPTREEVDAAHDRKNVLDIGIPSLKNLRFISLERRFLWTGLVITNIYSVIPVDQIFVDTGIYDTSRLTPSNAFDLTDIDIAVTTATFIRDKVNSTNSIARLSVAECLSKYSTQYVSSYGDVLLVHTRAISPTPTSFEGELDPTPDNGMEEYRGVEEYEDASEPPYIHEGALFFKPIPFPSEPSEYPSYQWQCRPRINDTCQMGTQRLEKSPKDWEPWKPWKPYGQQVQYCLAEKVHENCQVNFSLQFAVVVIVSNLLKVICMFVTLWRHDTAALITVGDAIQSFLERPDPHTRNLCMKSAHFIRSLFQWEREGSLAPQTSRFAAPGKLSRAEVLPDPATKYWRPVTQRWWKAVYIQRWLLSGIIYIILLIIAATAYFFGLRYQPPTWNTLQKMGIGDPVGNNIIPMNHSMLVTAIIANIPQVVLSYVYLLFNSIYTCMLANHEWTQFAANRTLLRVTSPVGSQRSSYWLQLPYQYSLPLIALSSLLKWAASQSIFVVKLDVLDQTRNLQADKSILTCGYSPGAIVLAIIFCTLIILGAGLLGLRKYPQGMPLAATCSAAISAACHRPDDDVDAAVLSLQWGVVSTKDGVGHCCFSSKPVEPPVPGRVYA